MPPIPQDLPEQRKLIDRDMMQGVWAEIDYRLNICRVTKGGHIEHLPWNAKKLGEFLFPSVGRVLQSFPQFKCTDFIKSRGIMTNPVYKNRH